MAKRYDPQNNLKNILNMLIIIAIIDIVICIVLVIKTINDKKEDGKVADGKTIKIDSVINEVELPDDVTITLSAIGDIMCHNTQYNDAYQNGLYDFSYVFDDIRDELLSADYAVGNLETTFAGSGVGYSSYPQFNTPESLAIAIKDAGIDLVSTANNHSLDTGYNGVESTINYLEQAGLEHTGTYKSPEAQDETTIVDIKGLKVAFLSFTYGTNGIAIPSGREYCINLINDEFIINRLNKAKEQNVDLICVFMHWGEEYEDYPNSEQIRLANLLFENGANIILGSHPHVLQRMEKVNLGTEEEPNEGFVMYSFGNFVSGQVKENTRNSVILNLTITKKGSGEVIIDSAKYTPIYTYKSGEALRKYKVLNIKRAIDAYNTGNKYITEDDYNTLSYEYNKIISTVGPEW